MNIGISLASEVNLNIPIHEEEKILEFVFVVEVEEDDEVTCRSTLPFEVSCPSVLPFFSILSSNVNVNAPSFVNSSSLIGPSSQFGLPGDYRERKVFVLCKKVIER